MTPAQRKKLLEDAQRAQQQAQKLMQEVEADEGTTTTTPAPAKTTTKTTTAPAAVKPVVKSSPQPVPSDTRAVETGPGGDTRKSGVPSVAQTMKSVWKKMRGIK